MRDHSCATQDEGFSLIEMLVVVAIISTVAALSFTSFSGRRSVATPETIAFQMVQMMREARLQAIGKREPVEVVVNIREKRFSINNGKPPIKIPVHFALELTVGRELITANEKGAILFYPDGSSSGGRVKITTPNSMSLELNIPWITGTPQLKSLPLFVKN
jgi:general secretion pathway protein H